MTFSWKIPLHVLAVLTVLCVPLVTHAISISGTLIEVTGWLLWAAANLFNIVLELFVLQMGSLVSNGGIGASIDAVWTVVRDVVNLTFIFGLIYIGFSFILGASTDARRMLSAIIIGALLVNFSLFISKLVIDVSNVTAVEIYQQMELRVADQDGALTDLSISEAFLAHMGILNLVTLSNTSTVVAESAAQNLDDVDASLSFVVGATVFILVASFVFAAGALLLAVRFGVLVLLMILSPIAFVAWFFPGIGAWSKWWWRTLFNQAFFAPAYLFMLYLTLVVASSYGTRTRGFDQIFVNKPGVFQEGFEAAAFFVVTIVLMVASLIVAKQMGAWGAGRALSLGNAARKVGQGFVLRNTAGRLARGTLNVYEKGTERVANSARVTSVTKSLSQSQIGRIGLGAVRGGANAVGRPIRTGLKAASESKYGGYSSLADDEKYEKSVTTTRERVGRERAFKEAFTAWDQNKNTDTRKRLQDEVRKRTLAELTALEEQQLQDVTEFLSNKQMDQITNAKDSGLSESTIAKLKEIRKTATTTAFNTALEGGTDTVREFFRDMKDEDIAKLGRTILTNEETLKVLPAGVLRKGADQNILSREDMEQIGQKMIDTPNTKLSASLQNYLDNPHFSTYYHP